MRRNIMEEKIARWISHGVGGSYIVIALFILSLMAIPKIVNGEILQDPFLIKVIVISILYVVSITLVATLPGKSVKRRAISWITSIVFHSSLLFYLGALNEWGSTILIVGMVETIILILSFIGLWLLVRCCYNNKTA